jgi:hypothetical protein
MEINVNEASLSAPRPSPNRSAVRWLLAARIALSALFAGHPAQAQRSALQILSATKAPLTLQRAELEKLGVESLKTSTPWTEGVMTFEGVSLKKVVDLVRAGEKTAVLTALNDYSAEIPLSDLDSWPVLIAWRMNGQDLTPRDKGYYWIMYPLDDHEELRNPATHQKLIWQLKQIEIK